MVGRVPGIQSLWSLFDQKLTKDIKATKVHSETSQIRITFLFRTQQTLSHRGVMVDKQVLLITLIRVLLCVCTVARVAEYTSEDNTHYTHYIASDQVIWTRGLPSLQAAVE